MKIQTGIALFCVALSSVEAFAIPPQHIWTKSLGRRSYRSNPVRRQIDIGGGQQQREGQQQEQKPQRQGGGGLTIGGLTLGGPSGGLSAPGLNLGGNGQQKGEGEQNRNATEAAGEKAPAAEGQKPAAEAEKPTAEAEKPAAEGQKPAAETEKPAAEATETKQPAAGAGTENQPGRAEGEAAKEEALKEAGQGEAAQPEKAEGVKATEESEKFSENIGIVLNEAGNAQNIGGNLGITEGTDGSKSVGGENGINIAKNGETTVAGNEQEYAERFFYIQGCINMFDLSLPDGLVDAVCSLLVAHSLSVRLRFSHNYAYSIVIAIMPMLGGGTDAMPTHRHGGGEIACSPTLTDADTITDGYTTDRDSNENSMLKLEIELENSLGDRVAELKKELIEQYNRASEAVKRAGISDIADNVTNSEELRAVQERLVAAETERNNALRALDEAKKTAEQAKLDGQLQSGRLQSAQAENQRLASELSAIRSANLNYRSTDVINLTAVIAERDAKIHRLESDATKYKTKAAQLKSKNTLKTNQDAVVFLEGRKENLEADNAELREKMARSATDLQRLQVVHANMLDQRNRTAPAQFASSAQDAHLTTENARLEDEIQLHQSKINALRSKMAYNITQLDLAWDGWRLFNCQHAKLQDIPDMNHSTRERTQEADIIMGLLEDWMDDDKFIKEYSNERRYILQHHRAHERVPQGRAVMSFRIKKEFVKADEKRGIPIRY
ncbi:hypothetical protein FB567DRAFT_447955 [Paraphoma chrysanthemicola]|uniref:Uncharacterized protein n=1 Tax=Paraphoma chrysanthemicola TaxID=798071 RepID=A0A8K0R1G1_9PLEO|nr:hypothetical protein FB567DRAFT_447955 [Paraphoma chrysanthemicola]